MLILVLLPVSGFGISKAKHKVECPMNPDEERTFPNVNAACPDSGD